ncbi:hypothetical protein DQ04_15221000 [Trypanosoma grayi]|uniref:hypothetical protein n=1 Tax=Trypanosoma grayi TaxID=71804 RepID=UPI0004F464CE|nr:hypothetical protein DQ04_15221000 [Trypanosoma grayi]KEG06214.1 hypothetical protein DQ04_15221000 [Trypanosoma grayi]
MFNADAVDGLDAFQHGPSMFQHYVRRLAVLLEPLLQPQLVPHGILHVQKKQWLCNQSVLPVRPLPRHLLGLLTREEAAGEVLLDGREQLLQPRLNGACASHTYCCLMCESSRPTWRSRKSEGNKGN